MYEAMTYKQILKRMVAYVAEHNTNIDTREGSVVWYGQAPAALELEQMYEALDTILKETYADTASREYLIKRAAERGLTPAAATKALLLGEFTPTTLALPNGTRFSLGNLNYVVVEPKQAVEPGQYWLECETPGKISNDYFGTLVPIEYIAGLETAKLVRPVLPGEDEEETEDFRRRYMESIESEAFGGNVTDYKNKVNKLQGVGGVKVYRAWNGDIRPAEMIPTAEMLAELKGLSLKEKTRAWLNTVSTAASDGLLTIGGTVRLVIIDSDHGVPTEEVVAVVQTEIDPEQNHGEGLGTAPIGHVVTVRGVEPTKIYIETNITYSHGWNWEALEPYAQEAIDTYFGELAKNWADAEEPLVVRISQVENWLLNLRGVVDIADTKLNGEESNVTLDRDSIPVRGDLRG